MKVNQVNSIARTAYAPASPVMQRLDAVRQGLRNHGAVILQDTELDREVIKRLETQFGSNNVRIEKSNAIKVTVSNFR